MPLPLTHLQSLAGIADELVAVLRLETHSGDRNEVVEKANIIKALDLAKLLACELRETCTKIQHPLVPDVVEKIIHYALAPSFLLDPSIAPGPNSPWCQSLRARKGYMSVCRSWYLAGRKSLYRDVVFRRPGQISALLRTLEDPNALCDYAPLIASIEINCYIPRTMADTLAYDLQAILDRCRDTLTTLKARETFWYGLAGAINLDLGKHVVLRALDCHGVPEKPYASPFNFFPYVSVLSLTLESLRMECSKLPTNLEPIRFDRLRFLCFRGELTGEQAVSVDFWEMPRLVHLDCFGVMQFRGFLKGVGKQLRYLCVHSPDSISSLASLCPNLRHLHFDCTLSLLFCRENVGKISHPCVEWVDMKFDEIDRSSEADINPFSPDFRARSRTLLPIRVPSLRGIRWFRRPTTLALNPELPLLIPPSLREDFDLHFVGFRMLQRRNVIFRAPPLWCLPDQEGSDEEETSDDESGESGTPGASRKQRPADLGGKEEAPTSEDGEQLSRGEILDIFSDTLQL